MKTILLPLLAALTAFGPLAHAEDDDEGPIEFAPQAAAVVQADACARKAAVAAGSAYISTLMDWGVDLPDAIAVDTIDTLARGKDYQIVIAGLLAYRVRPAQACTIQDDDVTALATARTDVNFDGSRVDALRAAAAAILGEEFFGPANIGAAHTFVDARSADLDAKGLVAAYFREWQGVDATAELVTDRSRANVEALLAAIDVKAYDGIPETGAKAAEILDLVMAALAETPRLKLVVGRWSASGIGDPAAGYVALVDMHLGEALVLEQGYVD